VARANGADGIEGGEQVLVEELVFSNDGYADLAIGVPYEDIDGNSKNDGGAVNILFGR
jgi:hypothetical protein